jgi:hypothetical protein
MTRTEREARSVFGHRATGAPPRGLERAMDGLTAGIHDDN